VVGSYGHHWLGESRPLVPSPPGVLHEIELFQELAARVGLKDEMAGSIEDYKRRLLGRLESHGVSLETLRKGPVRNPMAPKQLFEGGRVATESGKVALLSDLADGDPDPREDGDYPLWLLSVSTKAAQASQWSRDPGDLLEVTVHSDSANGRTQGEEIMLESVLGSIRARLRFDDRQRRDVAIYPKGGHYDRGQSANSLITARATDIGLGGAYLDCRVRIRAL
jgi:anaerobic selenocysteine-containing dehydrogenase